MGVLDDKVAIITGAGGGIGRAVSLLFAKEGARLVLNDLGTARDGTGSDPEVVESVARDTRALGADVRTCTESQATISGVEAIVRNAIDAFDKVDVLVCAAGIAADQPLARIDDAAWARVIATELTGPMHLTRLCASTMQRRGGGRIVLTTSPAGLLGSFGQVAYGTASAGVYGLMRTASVELQRHRIFVNAVAPLAKTRLTSDLPLFEHVSTMTPEHVAPAYLYFASNLSSDTTGTVLSVAGARISQYRVAESGGLFKEGDEAVWNAAEIGDALQGLAKSPPHF